MKVAYLDGFAGVAGDMFTAALIDAGVAVEEVAAALESLPVSGFRVEVEEVRRATIRALRFRVHLERHEHAHRGLRDVLAIVEGGALSEAVRERATRVFTHLAQAEARAHGIDVDAVHFHEVGAIDAIVDVVAGCFALDRLGVAELFCSPLQLGSGFVDCDHGRMPVPTPGALGALLGREVILGGPAGERTTPTGAALVAALGTRVSSSFRMTPTAIGHGAGSRDDGTFPNFLRIIVGEAPLEDRGEEGIYQIETNLDHVTPEQVGFALEVLLTAGAQDAWAQPVQMKKGRPAWVVSALVGRERRDAVEGVLFRETRTLGVRSWEARRRVLRRDVVTLETPLGKVRFKRAWLPGGGTTSRPEFEDVARIARETGRAFPAVAEELESFARQNAELLAREGGMVSGGHRHALGSAGHDHDHGHDHGHGHGHHHSH